MTITLDPSALRGVAHKLLDELLDKVGDALVEVGLSIVDPEEWKALNEADEEKTAVPPAPPQARIHEAALAPGTGRRVGPAVDAAVRAAAVIQDGVIRPALYIPAAVASRAGLVIGERCACERRDRDLVISPSAEGTKIGRCGDTDRVRITFFALTTPKKHPAEYALHHLDGDHNLVVALPKWWPSAPAPKQSATKLQPPAAAPAVEGNGAKPHGPHCDVCQEVKARKDLYECPACLTLVCRPETSGCFDSHVRREHHTKASNRVPITKGEAART